jgi:fructose-specific phosphotransferase system IIC component
MDWSLVMQNWQPIAWLVAIVFVASLIGNVISFNSKFFGAILAAVLFGVAIIFFEYYPHGLPVPKALLKPV